MGCFDVIYQKKGIAEVCWLVYMHCVSHLVKSQLCLLYVRYVIEAIAMLDLAYSCRFLLHLGAGPKDYLIYIFPEI